VYATLRPARAGIALCLFLTLTIETAAAQPSGYEGLGPRGHFDWRDYASLPPSVWSGKIVLKIREGWDPRLEGRRIVNEHGGLVLDVERVVGQQTVLGVEQGFGMDRVWLRTLQRNGARRCQCEVADLTTYFSLYLRRQAVDLPALLARLNAVRAVEIAYPVGDLRKSSPPVDIPPTTPDYSPQQGFGDPAPDGIDAIYASTFPGGDGEGVGVADIEIGWEWTHEDLETCVGGLINVGTLYTDEYDFIDHGTAVLGQIFAGDNGYGVTGLAPGASCHFAPDYTEEHGSDVSRAMLAAMDQRLQPGDVILLEAQTFGPNYDDTTPSQVGLVPVEWEPGEYDTIRTATTNGYIVVEAGANGYENLDDPVYNGHFDIAQYDSGAILVAAGTPPTNPPAHVPEYYTNHGSRMDLHAWGSLVVTSGYGDLFDGSGDPQQRYTTQFAGTSSASPIVAGAAALFSAIAQALGHFPTPTELRDVLIQTGTPQYADPKRIGPQPDLRAALDTLSVCGNGAPEQAEVCDDGNTLGGDGCSADCLSDETCGNTIHDAAAGEACDDGNGLDGDGCSANCLSDETCGNGVTDTATGETCDDGPDNGYGPNACRGDCQLPVCGDWITDPTYGEQCDDGNSIDDDGCSNTCRFPNEGCGCQATPTGSVALPFLLLALLLGWRRHRRRRE
jgi:serine protease